MIKSPSVSDRCRINMQATGCAELRRGVSTLTEIAEAMPEAFSKFDYVTQALYVRLCVAQCHTHGLDVKLSGLVKGSVNEHR